MNSYRTADGKAQLYWELKDTPKGPEFSAHGEYARGSGQCVDAIASAYPEDAMVQRIARVWEKYHLNGMQAGTVHQKALGWGHGRDIALDLTSMNDVQKEAIRKRNLERVAEKRKKFEAELLAKLGSDQRFRRRLWEDLFPKQTFTTWADEFIRDRALGYKARGFFTSWHSVLAERLPGWLSNAAELEFPAAPVAAEIFKDSLGAPCPVTGKLYGHEWYYHPIPDDVLAEIKSWSSEPQPVGTLGDHSTRLFLENNGITMRVTLSDSKPAPWVTAGHHYRVTLSRKGGRLVFDFWGSKADADVKEDPTQASILECISSDINTPDTFKDFCSEFGYETDSISGKQTFTRANSFAKRLRSFFRAEEIEQLHSLF